MKRTVSVLLAATVLAATFAPPAWAQLRSIPEDARLARMRHVQEMWVAIDGRTVRLAPGAQIRDIFNRIILPVALVPEQVVRYTVDSEGRIDRAWILSENERAAAR